MRKLAEFKPLQSACISFALLCSAAPVMAQPAEQPLGWLKNFVRVHNGNDFCVPAGARHEDYVEVISRYKQAHPELEGVLGGQSALAAFRESYPCQTNVPTASGSAPVPASMPEPAPAPAAPLQDEFSANDAARTTRILEKLASTAGHENDDLVEQIRNNAGDYQPPVLVALTLVLYQQGKTDEAIFWLSAARLRANYDALRCADASARPAARAIMSVVPRELLRAQFDDLAKLREIVSRVTRWDETTPHNYDQRWINRHGENAELSGAPQSLPRQEWPALEARARADYVASLDAAIKEISAQR